MVKAKNLAQRHSLATMTPLPSTNATTPTTPNNNFYSGQTKFRTNLKKSEQTSEETRWYLGGK